MSLPTINTTPAKKRKHGDNAAAIDDASRKKLKKEKKEKKEKSKKRDKGKAREDDAGREFKLVNASLVVSIPPIFANNPMDGVEEMLDSLVMRYVPALNGVLICHTNTRFLSQTASIKNECPFAVCTVGFDATVWSPQVGTKLTGKVNLCSPDHISLLVHKTFNVSIPRHHIPTDSWEFEYGPAVNDPEFGAGADTEASRMDVDGAGVAESGETGAGGRWIHKVTADVLGGSDGILEFTVIGLTIANQMLSLVGSLQKDPFSPEHTPANATASGSQQAIASQKKQPEPLQPVPPDVPAVPEESDIDDDDPFGALGRTADEAAAKEAAQKQRDEADAKAQKKKAKKEKKEKEAQMAALTQPQRPEVQSAASESVPKKKKKKKTSE